MAIFEIFTIILSTREHDNQKRVEEEKKLADEAKEKVSYMLHCTLVLYFTSVIFLSPPHCMHCYFRGRRGYSRNVGRFGVQFAFVWDDFKFKAESNVT